MPAGIADPRVYSSSGLFKRMSKPNLILLILIAGTAAAAPAPVPEIDPAFGSSALALISGAVLVLRSVHKR